MVKRVKFPPYEALIKVAVQLCAIEQKPAPSVLVGGLAMQLYGSRRLTSDVDVIARADVTRPPAGATRLGIGGFRTFIEGIQSDFIVPEGQFEQLYADAYKRAKVLTVEGGDIWVVSPEFLVVMKMIARRGRDKDDIKFLVLMDGEDINLGETWRLVRDYLGVYATLDLKEYIDTAEREKEQP